MSSPPYPLLQFLYDALAAEWGVVVATDDPERLRQKLYPLRKADEVFTPLAFIISPFNPSGELWIVKKEQPSEG